MQSTYSSLHRFKSFAVWMIVLMVTSLSPHTFDDERVVCDNSPSRFNDNLEKFVPAATRPSDTPSVPDDSAVLNIERKWAKAVPILRGHPCFCHFWKVLPQFCFLIKGVMVAFN